MRRDGFHQKSKGFKLAVSEADLSEFVKDYSQVTGWKRVHFRPLRRESGKWETPLEGDVGYPDWTLVRRERLVFAELKSATGTFTQGQPEWLDALRGVSGIEVYVWRPADIDDIRKILR